MYVDHIVSTEESLTQDSHLGLVPVRMSLHALASKLNMAQAVRVHGIKGFVRNTHIDVMRPALQHHSCNACLAVVTLLKAARKRNRKI